jgi:diguanylate cyclase
VPSTQTISEQALHYLQHQRLPPSPQNYWIAFTCHERSGGELSKALAALTDGGIRLTQAQADALYEQFFGRAVAEPTGAEQDRSSAAVRHHALRLADLASSATAVTGEFSRELTNRLPGIANADAASLADFVVVTLERSQRAERELEATSTQLEQLRQQLETVQGDAERDALTGLPNRRGIEAHLAAVRGSAEPLFMALCDIDRFKSYNDRYGHGVGDRVLKTVAQSLRETLPDCMVGRWGGEEFVIVGTAGVTDAVAMLERAKTALGDRHFKLRETDEPMGRITFSAGVTAWEPREEPAVPLERADALMYKAKEAGRDRVLGA